MKSRKVRWIVIVGTLVCASAGCLFLLSQQRSVQVWYHRNRMHSAWDKTFAKPKSVTSDGISGYTLGESFERYTAERQALINLGEMREINFKFKHLNNSTRNGGHFLRTIMSLRAFGDAPEFYCLSPSDPGANIEIQAWTHESKADEFQRWLSDRDVADYEEKFLRPDVIRRAEEAVSGWAKLGMWLPEDKQVEFFRSEFGLTRDILARELRNASPDIRKAAAYVIEELKADAIGVSPEIVACLREEKDTLVRIYLMNALVGIGDRSVNAIDAIRQRWAVPITPDEYSIDEKLTAASALWRLSEQETDRQVSHDFILTWLRPVPEKLTEELREHYLQRQLHAVHCVRNMPGFVEAVPALKKLLEAPAKDWMVKWVPEAVETANRQDDR